MKLFTEVLQTATPSTYTGGEMSSCSTETVNGLSVDSQNNVSNFDLLDENVEVQPRKKFKTSLTSYFEISDEVHICMLITVLYYNTV